MYIIRLEDIDINLDSRLVWIGGVVTGLFSTDRLVCMVIETKRLKTGGK